MGCGRFCIGLIIAVILTIAGCGGSTISHPTSLSTKYSSGSTAPGESLSAESTLSSNVVLLDTTATSKVVASDDATVVFRDAPDAVTSLKPGQIIIIEKVARKVVDVTTSGADTNVKTSEPNFAELVSKLEVNGDMDLTEAHLVQESLPKGVTFKKSGNFLKKIITGSSQNDYVITISDQVIYDNDGDLNTAWDQVLANGSINLTKPNIKFEYYYGVWHEKYAEMKFTAGEHVNLQVSSHNFKFEKAYKVRLGKFIVPVPVTGGVANMDIDINLVFDANGTASIVAGFSEELSIEEGIKATLNPYNLTSNNNTTFAFNMQEPTFEGNISASIGINPDVNLSLFQYDLTGIENSLAVGANATATATVNEACAEFVADAVISSVGYVMLPKASLEANFSWNNFSISADIGMVRKEKEIFSARRNFYDSGQLCTSTATGTVNVNVRDALTSAPLSGATVTVTSASGRQITSEETDSAGAVSLTIPEADGYTIDVAKTGYQSNTYHSVSVTADQVKYLATILQIDNNHLGSGSVSGRIINALTGSAISGAAIELRTGVNNTSAGIVSLTLTTNEDGYYSIPSLEAGNYTAKVSADGYTTAFFTITAIGNTAMTSQNYTLTPIVPEGQTRIVLTWGDSPSDLDSHLTGPMSNGRFHLYYGNKVVEGANLDRDDTDYYGPETTTITSQAAGIYRYSVHDFSNMSSTSSTALSNSGAKVTILRGEAIVAEFYVPNNPGTLWTVCEINGNVITPINTMTYSSSSDSVSKPVLAPLTDGNLMRYLPPKK